ncbi:MAG: chlorite dismutase family protein [Candidatus Latescibacteria bacterium]|nr:chlorite dismutase family protein [Candidatus Latescibacterota bacterium]
MRSTPKDQTLDLREKGKPINGQVQASNRRLYMQLHVFENCPRTNTLVDALCESGVDAVLYVDLNHPSGVGILTLSESPEAFAGEIRTLLNARPFAELQHIPDLTMFGRTYAHGYEPDLEETLLRKPRRKVLDPDWPWAVWYPLRRKPEFGLLSGEDLRGILGEHARVGRAYAEAGFAQDVRLACYGLDRNDNDFVIGLLGPELHPLSHVVQEMRKTRQTAQYVQSLGPFFVGKAIWQSPL